MLSFLSAVGTVGAIPHISPLWQAVGTLRGSSHHFNVTRKRAEGVWGVEACCPHRGVVLTVTRFDLGLRPDGPLYVVIGVRCDASREWGWGVGQRAAGSVRVRRVVG